MDLFLNIPYSSNKTCCRHQETLVVLASIICRVSRDGPLIHFKIAEGLLVSLDLGPMLLVAQGRERCKAEGSYPWVNTAILKIGKRLLRFVW